eukprot:scaffold6438_cov181-Amphora_coffeaeformis.AAC.4
MLFLSPPQQHGLALFAIQSRNLPVSLLRAHAAADGTMETLEGPFSSQDVTRFWGQNPFVVRKAFQADDLLESKTWPNWQDIVDLACSGEEEDTSWQEEVDDEDDDDDQDVWGYADEAIFLSTGQSARLIRHTPGKLDTFRADLGPFTYKDLEQIDNKEKWSLLMNDVDRYRPALADWMDENFGFLPRWRRDDAQISIAPTGGGIGPHVDSYDVFLIQAAGTREWRIQPSPTVSIQEEMDRLLPGISVRILEPVNESTDFVSVKLEAGDMLYLPPRVTHWGISTSDDCMTLSVGCRAPAAQEIVARLAENILSSFHPTASQRYAEEILPATLQPHPSITPAIRVQMKDMVLKAVENALADESEWDKLLGKLVTEPKRLSEVPMLEDQDDDYLDKWGSTPKRVLTRVKSHPKAFLKRASGISFATSRIVSPDGTFVDRLFANGKFWETCNDKRASELFHCIEQGIALTAEHLVDDLSLDIENILLDLIADGLLVVSA